MERLKFLNRFLSGRSNTSEGWGKVHMSKFFSTLFISVTVFSCTSSTGFKESDDRPTEEPPVYIITTSLPGGIIGTAYSATLSAGGGNGNYTWEIVSGDLPEGLNLDTATGEISGDPATDGSFDFTTEVSSAGTTDSKNLNILIESAAEATTRNTVINVDFMSSILEEADEEVYVGDDGVLSSADGTFWNEADAFTGKEINGAIDEFGDPTYVEMTADFVGLTFIGAATNRLQDHGVSSAGIPENNLELKGLLTENEYDLAIYVYHENSIEQFTTLKVTHADDEETLTTKNDSTWNLPGEKDKDYFLLENVKPYEISDGVYGFRIDNLNDEGTIMGLQLKGLVPAPGE